VSETRTAYPTDRPEPTVVEYDLGTGEGGSHVVLTRRLSPLIGRAIWTIRRNASDQRDAPQEVGHLTDANMQALVGAFLNHAPKAKPQVLYREVDTKPREFYVPSWYAFSPEPPWSAGSRVDVEWLDRRGAKKEAAIFVPADAVEGDYRLSWKGDAPSIVRGKL
jgi:hypothetical protein